MRMGKFVLFQDKRKEWRFNLQASNGKVISTSEGYKSKSGALNGMRSILKTMRIMATTGLIYEERV